MASIVEGQLVDWNEPMVVIFCFSNGIPLFLMHKFSVMLSDQQQYQLVKKKLAKRKAYFQAVFSWLSTSFFLFILNMMSSPGHHWWRFVFIGWGIGIFFKTMKLLKDNLWDGDWEYDQLNKELSKSKKNRPRQAEMAESVLDLNQPVKQKEPAAKYWNEKDFV